MKPGDVVVVQDRALSTAELDAARAQLAEAEARVEELKNGPLQHHHPRRRGAPRPRRARCATTPYASAIACSASSLAAS